MLLGKQVKLVPQLIADPRVKEEQRKIDIGVNGASESTGQTGITGATGQTDSTGHIDSTGVKGNKGDYGAVSATGNTCIAGPTILYCVLLMLIKVHLTINDLLPETLLTVKN